MTTNPFLIHIPDKNEYTNEDYIQIQNKLDEKKEDSFVMSKIQEMYSNTFYTIQDFNRRITQGFKQIIYSEHTKSSKNLYKIGKGGNNCICCCTILNDTRMSVSKKIQESLENVGFDGFFYLFHGYFPNPTGTEMKYIGVPYCFKIFMMLEAQKKGFDRVIWIDANCYAINNPEILFNMFDTYDTVIKSVDSSNYDAMVFQDTISLLNNLTGSDLRTAKYIESIVFGLNLSSAKVKKFISDYYEMVELGYPFFSIFPEEIVFSALFNKPEYASLIQPNSSLLKTRIHEDFLDENIAKMSGFIFHHKKYVIPTTLLENNEDLLTVYHFQDKIRCGLDIDGGYVIGNLDTVYDCFITAGISENDDFSVDFMNRYKIHKDNCYAFDGTIENIPVNLRDILTFVNKNIGSENNDKITNLDYICDKYENIFLKMDIEGGEWSWLMNITEDRLSKFAQLTVELHGMTNVSWHGITINSFNCGYAEKTMCLKKLAKSHYLIHAHGNNADLTAPNGMPNVIEVLYLNKKFFKEKPKFNTTALPIAGLDFPNEIRCPDINLNFFPFVSKREKSKLGASNRFVSFDDGGGRFGNQLFRYLTAKLFTIHSDHAYISRELFPTNSEVIYVTEYNIEHYLKNIHLLENSNIILQGYFQKSCLFEKDRIQLIECIFQNSNIDYWITQNQTYKVKDYLITPKCPIKLNSEDVVVSLRLDDFIQYPCHTSDILPPQFYMDVLYKHEIKSKLYIVCDKLKHDWEFKYLEYFKQWNPILIQNDLKQDIALMLSCKTLIHSNSSLCWIMSFLSTKTKRYIPLHSKRYMNQNQHLTKVEDSDSLIEVTQLDHHEVHNLDCNEKSIFPFSFSIPEECVVESIPEKTCLLATLIPGEPSTYTFNKTMEKEYNDMYKTSRFAITKMKGGWDCLRHFEILMNGCIPLFENLTDCPTQTLTSYPKHLNASAYALYNNWQETPDDITEYNALVQKYLEHTKTHCTASACSKYFLRHIKNSHTIKNVLLITGHHGVNYNREMLWIGLKRHICSMNGTAVEYPKMPFLYDDFDNSVENPYYGNNCFTFPKRLQKDSAYDMSENEIIQKIDSNFWDLIIYGKVGPDEFCTFPYFDLVRARYNKNNIAFIFGGDEIFDLSERAENSSHVNMFNMNIPYKPYKDYLQHYSQFGMCFVRELNH